MQGRKLMRNFLAALIILALGACSQWVEAKSFSQPRVIGEQAAVQFWVWRTTPHDLDDIKAAGFNNVRFVMSWQVAEQQKDAFTWTQYDRIMRDLRDRDMGAIIVLMGGNENYSPLVDVKPNEMIKLKQVPLAPATPESVNGFARFAAKAAARYGDQKVVWEIWNEPDLHHFWYPKVDAAAYARLADATCHAIKAVEPEATVIGPSAAALPSLKDAVTVGFLEILLKSPAANCLDALSIHAYRGGYKTPESVSEDYTHLKKFIAKHTPSGQSPLPIICSEWGYPTTKVTPDLQAAYAVRTHMMNLLNDVPLSVWYEWRDSRDDGTQDHESNFGLHEYDNTPKPQWLTVKPVMAELASMKLVKRLDAGHKNAYAVLLASLEGQQKILTWWAGDPDQPAPVAIFQSGKETHEVQLAQIPQLIDSFTTISVTHKPASQQ